MRQQLLRAQICAAGLDGWAFLEFRRLIWRIFSVIGGEVGGAGAMGDDSRGSVRWKMAKSAKSCKVVSYKPIVVTWINFG